jgi:hypothetical protein
MVRDGPKKRLERNWENSSQQLQWKSTPAEQHARSRRKHRAPEPLERSFSRTPGALCSEILS